MVIEVERREGVCVLCVVGSLVAEADPEYLTAAKAQLKGLKPEKVLVDLSRMPYIGSTGIGFIVGIFSTVKVGGGRFVMVGLEPRVHDVFQLVRLHKIIPSEADVASGVAYLSAETSRVGSPH